MKPTVFAFVKSVRVRNTVLALMTGVAFVAASLSPVEAGHRHHHHDNWGGAAAAGIIGLATGAIVGSALSNPGYYGGPVYYDGPIYYDPPRYRYAPPPYPYRSRAYVAPPRYYPAPAYRLVPWSPEWIAYCARKYKSFNPRTGTYRTYGGRIRMCH